MKKDPERVLIFKKKEAEIMVQEALRVAPPPSKVCIILRG